MGLISVVGLGARLDELTLGAINALKSAKVILRTRRHPVSGYLKEQGIAFESLDELYERSEDFDELIQSAVDALVRAARDQDIAYGVADLRDSTVEALLGVGRFRSNRARRAAGGRADAMAGAKFIRRWPPRPSRVLNPIRICPVWCASWITGFRPRKSS